jgi:hypothetical protein
MFENPTKKPQKYKVERTRHYKPYRDLMAAAYHALEDAKEGRPGSHYYQLTVIIFSALAVEAVANTFGEELIEDWQDSDRIKTCKKLNLVSEKLGVPYDEGCEPWSSVRWLIRVRNRLVHGRPQAVNFNKVLTKVQLDAIARTAPKSKIEEQISLKNSERAFGAVDSILDLFIESMPEKEQHRFRGDGWSGCTSLLRDEN